MKAKAERGKQIQTGSCAVQMGLQGREKGSDGVGD